MLLGAKGSKPEQVNEFMLNVWSAIILAVKHAHPIDTGSSEIMSRVGSQTSGASRTELSDGLRE
eukprot:7376278-Prymnesium_polylepis.2